MGTSTMRIELHELTLQELSDELATGPDLSTDPDFVAELAKANVIEDILTLMREQDINKRQLAGLLQKSRQYVGKVLNEHANFTVERLAEFACALGGSLEVRIYSQLQEPRVRALPEDWHKLNITSLRSRLPVSRLPKATQEGMKNDRAKVAIAAEGVCAFGTEGEDLAA